MTQVQIDAAELAALREKAAALDGLLLILCHPGENSIESFERVAENFRRETGKIAPGKDAPAAYPGCSGSRAEFNAWSDGKIAAALAAAREVVEQHERGRTIFMRPAEVRTLARALLAALDDAARGRALLADTVALADAAMHMANRDGGEFDRTSELSEARAFLASPPAEGAPPEPRP